MACRTTWARWCALLWGLSIAGGCKGERERFPPPQPYPGGAIDTPAGGAGGSGVAGGAGGATSTGGTTSTGTPVTLNVCECAFGMVSSDACGSCLNDLTAPGKTCEAVSAECKLAQGCDDLFACRLACVGKPEAEQITCIQGCYAGVDLSSSENHTFVNLMDCLCKGCAIKCAPDAPITCE